jgi:hypothetical protein
MKTGLLVTAAASLGLSAAANAQAVTADTITIWNGVTTNPVNQQGLPSAIAGLTLESARGGFPSTTVVNWNDPSNGTDTIGGFFNRDTPAGAEPTNCNAVCQAVTLSTPNFATGTILEIQFTLPTTELFTVTHDDGVSVFVDGNTTNNLLPGQSAPTAGQTGSVVLGAGTYDLWYAEQNGLPAILDATAVPVQVPGPIVGAGLPGLLTGLGGLVALARRRRRKG